MSPLSGVILIITYLTLLTKSHEPLSKGKDSFELASFV